MMQWMKNWLYRRKWRKLFRWHQQQRQDFGDFLKGMVVQRCGSYGVSMIRPGAFVTWKLGKNHVKQLGLFRTAESACFSIFRAYETSSRRRKLNV